MAELQGVPEKPRILSEEGRRAAVRAWSAHPADRVESTLLSKCLRYSAVSAAPSAAAIGLLVHSALGSSRIGSLLGNSLSKVLLAQRGYISVGVASLAWCKEIFQPASESCWPCYAQFLASQSTVGTSMRNAYRSAALQNHNLDARELQAAEAVADSALGAAAVRERETWARIFSTWLFSTHTVAIQLVCDA